MSGDNKTASVIRVQQQNAIMTAEEFLKRWAALHGFYEYPKILDLPPEAVVAFTNDYTRYLQEAAQQFQQMVRDLLDRTPTPPFAAQQTREGSEP